jgi:hypothetical protein
MVNVVAVTPGAFLPSYVRDGLRARHPNDKEVQLEWFTEKLRLMLTFEGDPADAEYLLDEWPEGLLARVANPTPVDRCSDGRSTNLAQAMDR